MIAHQKGGHPGLLYGSKSLRKKWEWIGIFKPADPHSHGMLGIFVSQNVTNNIAHNLF